MSTENFPSYRAPLIASSFILHRAHSLSGIWFVVYLIEHLFTNSQAALLIGENGEGFVRAVNWIKDLPYLSVIEFCFLAIPFLFHGIWGIIYIFQSKNNCFSTDGTTPSLPRYPRNKFYTWQRITAWILLFGITAHVIQMRFLEHPSYVRLGTQDNYFVPLNKDNGLQHLSETLGFELYDQNQIDQIKPIEKEHEKWVETLSAKKMTQDQIVAVTHSFGVAELLVVRDTFKEPLMIILYTGLVLAACFHAFNGLWTAMITWGITLTQRSQYLMRMAANCLMVLITFLGLAAVWGTYWINLR